MTSSWLNGDPEQRGAYTSVAQTEDSHAGRISGGKEADAEDAAVKQDERPVYIGSVPEPEDFLFLPRVADTLPYGAFLVAVVELCERFAYYGLSGPFQNYIANKYRDPSGLPGALGLSQSTATAVTNLFQLWCYVTPLCGAIIADQYLGKYATIKWFSLIYLSGIAVLFATSLPWSIENGAATPGLIIAMVIIGIGTGGIKSNVGPLIAEQVRSTEPFVKSISNTKQVIVDPDLTLQRVFMVFYSAINIGSISAIATTMLELHVGFWSAFLLPMLMFCVGYAVLVSGKKRYIIKPPQGGVIGNCFRALWIAIRNNGNLEMAKPSNRGRARGNARIDWSDSFVDELKSALVACKAFLFFPIYWLCYSQITNNLVSQAGQMQLHGLPNDILPNIDPITIIILIPIMDRYIYPFLRRRFHLALKPTTRITCGFLMAASAMLYAGGVQTFIYAAPPCYSSPLNCDASKTGNGGGRLSNQIHVAWQAPAYILVALSEILANVTGLELAYSKAPSNMKSFIMSLFLLTSAGGSMLGILVAPLAKDPYLPWLYFGLAGLATGAGYGFHRTFRGLHESEKILSDVAEYELADRAINDDESDPSASRRGSRGV